MTKALLTIVFALTAGTAAAQADLCQPGMGDLSATLTVWGWGHRTAEHTTSVRLPVRGATFLRFEGFGDPVGASAGIGSPRATVPLQLTVLLNGQPAFTGTAASLSGRMILVDCRRANGQLEITLRRQVQADPSVKSGLYRNEARIVVCSF